MDDISALIKEAKPLYFVRKRRKRVIKSLVAMVCLLWLGGIAYYQPSSYTQSYYWDSEFSVSDKDSVIDELGLPTDEYGLLLVG